MFARPLTFAAVLFAVLGADPAGPRPAGAQGLADVFDLPAAGRDRLTVSAALTDADGLPLSAAPAAGETVTLAVTARLPKGFYLVSQTSPVGTAAEFRLTAADRLAPAADGFEPGRKPKVGFDPVYGGLLEKFTGTVTWARPFTVTAGEGPVRVAGELRGSYCSTGVGGTCVPIGPGDARFEATLKGPGQSGDGGGDGAVTLPRDVAAGPLRFEATPAVRGRSGAGPVAVAAELPAGAAVGQTVELTVTLTVEEGFHVYALGEAGATAIPTAIRATPTGLEPTGQWTPSAAPKLVEKPGFTLREHHGEVTFSRPYEVTAADYAVAGSVKYQVCTDSSCLPPKTVLFELGDPPSASPGEEAALLADAGSPGHGEAGEGGAAELTELADTFTLKKSWLEESGLWAALAAAFAGGLILNVMPCVLPVIAIKAMSFAQQAGESRGTILKLNLWYAAGVLAVFGVFAGLALGLGAFANVDSFGWGDQTNSNLGKVIFTALVFAMGLAMLGLYEIPVPGFVGSAAGAHGQKEGATGAFLGGVLTTLLATPCTGPFLGAAGGVAVGMAKTNPVGSVALWLAMGLGFASPYLLFAVIPGATRLLPKPGMWMVRFKEFGGLLLIGTALWLLSGVRPYELWLPILVGLLGLAAGLWVVGRMIAHNDSPSRKYVLRAAALATTAATLALAVWLAPPGGLNAAVMMTERAGSDGWEPFDVARLNDLRRSGKTVLVEFTSGNCPNCRLNERFALDTDTAHAAYEQLDVTPMKAWIDRTADAAEWHAKLGGFGVPHLAVFPGGAPDDPAVVNGLISQGTLLEMLEEATGREFDPRPVRTAAK